MTSINLHSLKSKCQQDLSSLLMTHKLELFSGEITRKFKRNEDDKKITINKQDFYHGTHDVIHYTYKVKDNDEYIVVYNYGNNVDIDMNIKIICLCENINIMQKLIDNNKVINNLTKKIHLCDLIQCKTISFNDLKEMEEKLSNHLCAIIYTSMLNNDAFTYINEGEFKISYIRHTSTHNVDCLATDVFTNIIISCN